MQASRARVEIIRFGLLITLTLALVTVAHRATSDHHSGTSATGAHTTNSPSQSATGGSSPSASASSGGSANSGGATSGSGNGGGNTGGTANSGGSNSGNNSGGTGTSSSGNGTSGGSVGVQTLPRTGPTDVAILVALGFVMIGGGALSLSWSRASARPRPSTPGTR